MDWFKVKVKHAEYDFMGAPDNVFRAWIMMMAFVAASERIPTKEELELRLGPKNYKALNDCAMRNKFDLNHIMKKVMEDVDQVKNKREAAKVRQAKYRAEHASNNPQDNPSHNASHNADVTDRDKIREEEIREDKSNFNNNKGVGGKPFLDFSYLEPEKIKTLLKLFNGKDGVRAHLKGMGFYEARIEEALKKAGVDE